MHLSELKVVILTVLVFVASTLYASLGLGGASGDIAAMGFVGVPAESMKPIALILNLLVAALATYKFYRSGNISGALLWPFALSSVPAAFVGGRVSLPSHIYQPLVGFLLLYAAYRLVRFDASQERESVKKVPLIVAVCLGAVIGLLSGLIGVGGGIFLSPLLVLAGWATTRQSAGVSTAFILINSVAGLAGSVSSVHHVPGLVVW